MQTFRHWTPIYIINRIALFFYQKIYPNSPWLTKHANLILSSLLKPTDMGLEWGSGRSTIWFAKRTQELTSVEHDPTWYKLISENLKSENISNVKYFFCEYDKSAEKTKLAFEFDYVKVADNFSNNSLDFILVDGVYRDACACVAIKKIRPGGILIIDNMNWFLPSKSISPSSRKYRDEPLSELWREFADSVKNWRVIWTSNGITDTAIWIKPC